MVMVMAMEKTPRNNNRGFTIAVDFDGTIVEHKYPAIGREKPFAIDTLKQLSFEGYKLILWTARDGNLLEEAVEFCRANPPDIALLDVKMPLMDGVTACGAIHRENPGIAIVMLSLYCDSDRVLSAIANGARGYLLKSIYARELRDRLQSVLADGAVLSDEAAAVCFEAIRKQRFAPVMQDADMQRKLDMLTDHEKELLHLVALGASNKEIAERLYIGESTVKKQLNVVTTKLELKNRVQAATFALRSGLAE